jgi:hypothetical protein
MDQEMFRWVLAAYALMFLGIWLVGTSLNGLLSGWFRLQRWYADDGTEAPLRSMRARPAFMGRSGVRLSGRLTLGATAKGLSLRVLRLFAPFQRPLLIPWSDITASAPMPGWLSERIKLHFGQPAIGQLTLSAKSWAQLVEAAGVDPAGFRDEA